MSTPVTVNILGKDYQIACAEDQKQALYASARLVDQNMSKIRSTGKVVGVDRIAVMAALNLANELLELKNGQDETGQELDETVTRLKQRIERFLDESRQLEL